MNAEIEPGASARGGTGTPRGRVVFFGAGAFGIPTLERLASEGRVALVVSQPPRRAGRGLEPQPTPIAALARSLGLPVLECAAVGAEPESSRIREAADSFVVIAFGQKLPPELLRDRFAINLHGSILPRWRGAAPIQRAVMAGDRRVGVSVIELAERMDAGDIHAVAETEVGGSETAGELHDRLARLGPELIERTLDDRVRGTLRSVPQDDSLATRARKLSRDDAWVDCTAPAVLVAARINGLSPWPGCDARIGREPIRVLRARAVPPCDSIGGVPGEIDASGHVRCGDGAIELLEVQSPGGRVMPFDAWRRGHADARAGARLESSPGGGSSSHRS